MHSDMIEDSSLLTPPLTPTGSHDAPFKPDKSDTTSLTMKRRRGGHRPHSRQQSDSAVLSRAKVEVKIRNVAEDKIEPVRIKSMPLLRDWSSQITLQKDTLEKIKDEPYAPKGRLRRWTLPSKAAAIKGTPSFVLVEKQQQKRLKPESSSKQSPAMITLRRASTTRKPRKTSITFFPPPKFNQDKKNFFSSLLHTVTRSSEPHVDLTPSTPKQPKKPMEIQHPIINRNKVNPMTIKMADPVWTEIVNVEPNLSLPDHSTSEGISRSSTTRFRSRNSMYEIIWDTSSSSSRSNDDLSKISTRPDHRRSVAMDRLEMQLIQDREQSRRQSVQACMIANQTTCRSTSPSMTRRASFRTQLDLKLSRYFNEAALQNLPRSRSSRTRPIATPVGPFADENDELIQDSDSSNSTGHIIFFPPLRSRARTDASEIAGLLRKHSTYCPASSSAALEKLRAASVDQHASATGTSPTTSSTRLGCNRRTRRRTSGFYLERPISSNNMSIPADLPPLSMHRPRLNLEDETTPLLSAMG